MATGRVPTTANSPLTAKGDLFGYSTTQARVAVGSDGDTLVADSASSVGLRYQANFAAGKNKIINGDYTINQRNFTSVTGSANFTFDRWRTELSGGTVTYTPQTFTPGAAPVAGYEATNFLRIAVTGQSANSHYALIEQRIEDVRTLANQTVTLSFWAKASSGTPKVGTSLTQRFSEGGGVQVITKPGDVTISTSWARYSLTVALPSISGQTILAGSSLRAMLWISAGSDFTNFTNIGIQTATIDIWGVQLEAGNVATAFQTATGTLQGELAACQRYYYEMAYSGAEPYGSGAATSTTSAVILTALPVSMRVVPTAVYTGTFRIEGGASKTGIAAASLSLNQVQNQQVLTAVTSSSLTAGWGFVMLANGASAIKLSAEL